MILGGLVSRDLPLPEVYFLANERLGYFEKIHLFKKDAKLFIVINSLNAFGFGISSVIFNFYILEIPGFQADFLGVFMSFSMFATAGIALLAGMLIGRFCKKTVVLLATSITDVMLLVQYTVIDPIGLLLSQILLGVSSAFNQVTWTPYISSLSTDEERAHLFATNSGLSVLGVFFGNLLGGFLPGVCSSLFGVTSTILQYRYTLWLSMIPIITGTILIGLMSRDTGVRRNVRRSMFRIKNKSFIGKYALTVATVGIGAGMIVQFFNIYFKYVFIASDAMIGIIFGINMILLSTGNFIAPALADRFGKVRTIALTEALSIPFLLMLWWAPTIYYGVIAFVSRNVLMNMSGPISAAFLMENVSDEERSTAMGVSRSGDSFVRGIAAIIGGKILSMGFYRLPYLLVASLYVLAVILFYLFFHTIEAKKPAEVEVSIEPETEFDEDII